MKVGNAGKAKVRTVLVGVPSSPGFAMGRVFPVINREVSVVEETLPESRIPTEEQLFLKAVGKTAKENVISYLFDNMPFTAQLINAYLDSHYELNYTSSNRRFFSGSNGRSLSGDFYWALQDSAGHKLGMRNLFFGYGHAKILKWSLHGTAIAYLDMDEVSRNELKYKLTAIVFPANTVLNSIMQMKVFKSVVDQKIDNIVNDIKKASGSYFSGNKEPMLKSAVLKSDENVQYIIDFENVVNGGHWRLGDFEKLQKERAERDKNSVPIIMDEKSAPAIIEKKKGK